MIYSTASQPWIIVMFRRDDGERLILGDDYYEFKSDQKQFAANTLVNDVVDVQGGDGQIFAGQVQRASTQSFDGFIGDATTSQTTVEKKRREFFAFFATGHYFDAIYVFADGTAIKRRRGFLVDAPEVQEEWQIFPEYHVALGFEDINYYEYLEDEDGGEIYGHRLELERSGQTSGGAVWDETGWVWDTVGGTFEGTGAASGIIEVNSIKTIYPIVVINATTSNFEIENATTNTKIYYDGTVAEGQSLVINCVEQYATLNGVNVTENLSGDWLSFDPGENKLVFIAEEIDAPPAIIEWAEVVG